MTTTVQQGHCMHYAVFGPFGNKIDELEASSEAFLKEMILAYVESKPKAHDDELCGYIAVRAKTGEDSWKRDEWRRATFTESFRNFANNPKVFKLDPVAIAWAAGNDDPYSAVEDE